MKKVAQVLRRFTFEKWGGTETVVFNIAQALQNIGILSPIFCTDMFSKQPYESAHGVSIFRHPFLFPWFGLSREQHHRMQLKGGSPLSFSLFMALLLEKDLSLIHCHIQHRIGGIKPFFN